MTTFVLVTVIHATIKVEPLYCCCIIQLCNCWGTQSIYLGRKPETCSGGRQKKTKSTQQQQQDKVQDGLTLMESKEIGWKTKGASLVQFSRSGRCWRHQRVQLGDVGIELVSSLFFRPIPHLTTGTGHRKKNETTTLDDAVEKKIKTTDTDIRKWSLELWIEPIETEKAPWTLKFFAPVSLRAYNSRTRVIVRSDLGTWEERVSPFSHCVNRDIG